MANFDRIDLMNFVKYGNDFDDQWDEIRNYIKSNPTAQKEVEDIKKSLPQTSSYNRKRMESFERTNTESPSESSASPSGPQTYAPSSSNSEPKKWWSKLLGDD
ncbi:MAG: hypothetical protein JJT78_01335 [Leptospira sp.]|nr:hypothetical protein [Leptospira sp.]